MRDSCHNGKVRIGGRGWKETTKQGTESGGQSQSEIQQGTETVNFVPTNLTAQNGKSKAEEADLEKVEASAKDGKNTQQTQRENER